MPRLTEKQEEKFWDEVDKLSQEKIYNLLTNNIPLSNLKLITESWRYEDKQQKLTGLFLHKDVDYRTLLSEVSNQYPEDPEEESSELPSKEYLAEEIAVWYYRIVIKGLLNDLNAFEAFDPSYFESLTD